MKSQEQRIEDAAAAMWSALGAFDEGEWAAWDAVPDGTRVAYREHARKILEAADREPPAWPTDESINAGAEYLLANPAAGLGDVERDRAALRAAFLADPIIKAAVDLRDAYAQERLDVEIAAVIDAVKDAGL